MVKYYLWGLITIIKYEIKRLSYSTWVEQNVSKANKMHYFSIGCQNMPLIKRFSNFNTKYQVKPAEFS